MSEKQEEIILHIRDDKSILLEILEKGSVKTKMITPDALIECIKGSLSGFRFSTGILPSNIVSMTVDTDNDCKYVVVEYQHEKADITYMKTVYSDFPLPRLLFGFTVESSGRISSINMGVPKLGKLKPETPMYYYPFSNVSRFSLCTGSNSLPNIQTLQSLRNLPEYILALPDNDDYYQESHNRLKLGHRDLLEHLKDKDRQYYYDSILVPMPGTTLENFL